MGCVVKEAVDVRLNTGNFNRNTGFILSQASYPVTDMLANQVTGMNSPSM